MRAISDSTSLWIIFTKCRLRFWKFSENQDDGLAGSQRTTDRRSSRFPEVPSNHRPLTNCQLCKPPFPSRSERFWFPAPHELYRGVGSNPALLRRYFTVSPTVLGALQVDTGHQTRLMMDEPILLILQSNRNQDPKFSDSNILNFAKLIPTGIIGPETGRKRAGKLLYTLYNNNLILPDFAGLNPLHVSWLSSLWIKTSRPK